MNIENISVGEVFPTLNALIKATGENPKRGDSKKAQLKKIECCLAYEKTGKISRGKTTNEIIITDIFSIPKIKVDKRGIYKDDYLTLLSTVPNGIYPTTKLFEKMFSSSWDSKYIKPWEYNNSSAKNIIYISQYVRDRFSSNLDSAINKSCNYAKHYKLWNGEEWSKGVISKIKSNDDSQITNEAIEEIRQTLNEHFKKEFNTKRLSFSEKKYVKDEFLKLIKKAFGYENICVVYQIINTEQSASRSDVIKARKSLRSKLTRAVVKYCGNHFYYEKDKSGRKTRIPYYMFCRDEFSIDFLNQIAGDSKYIQNNPKLLKIGRTTYFGRKAKGS